MKRFTIIAGFVLVVFVVSLSLAEIPRLINYQGMLTTPAGSPVTDGQYNLTFKIYDSESEDDSLWWEHHSSVQVTDGLFNVILGSISSIPSSAFEDSLRYLGIQVGTDLELTSRIRLTSVSYAYRALVADSAVVAVSAPTGGGWVDDGNVVRLITDSDNVGIGTASPSTKLDVSGNINTTDSYLINGNQALSVQGTGNTFGGIYAGTSNTGTENTFLGESAGHSNTSGSGNTFLGSGAGYTNTTGEHNTFIGREAGKISTGTENVFLGSSTGAWNTTGSYNTYLGTYAGLYNSNGINNTFLGCRAGVYDTGSGNVFIGYYAGSNEKGSNKLYIANSDTDPPLIYGDFSTGRLGFGTTSPSGETKVHIQAVSDNFGVLVDAAGTSGSEIGLHTASSKYASLAKNAYFAGGGWQRFDVSSGAFLQEIRPDGEVWFRVAGSSSNPISWTNALAIKTSGNVGIGTNNPQRALHISDVLRLQPRGSAPSSPSEGDVYVSSSNHHIYCYLDGTWKQLDN